MSNLLNKKYALTKLKAELEGKREKTCQSSGTWPKIVGKKKRRRREKLLPRISSKYWQAK